MMLVCLLKIFCVESLILEKKFEYLLKTLTKAQKIMHMWLKIIIIIMLLEKIKPFN